MKKIIFFLKQVKHTFWIMYLDLEGWRDYYRLYFDFPQLKDAFSSCHSQYNLTKSYTDYSNRISHPKMAISLELASFLYNLCIIIKPKIVFDLGSGFSTYVFALYRHKWNRTMKLWSVDNDIKWLSKTRAYLQSKKLTYTTLISWSSFNKLSMSQFPCNLVLYDLGTMKIRAHFFSYILSHIKKGAFVVIDDMHMLDYSRLVRKHIRTRNVRLYSLRSF